MNRIPEIMVLFVFSCLFLYFSYIVWFQYQIYQSWQDKIHSFAYKKGLPFWTFSQSLTNTPNYKWLVRFVALFMLLAMSCSLFTLLYDLNN